MDRLGKEKRWLRRSSPNRGIYLKLEDEVGPFNIEDKENVFDLSMKK